MELDAAVRPLVYSPELYAALFGEDDPEELSLMQVQDQEKARQIEDVLRDLYALEVTLSAPAEIEGEQLELGDSTELDDLRSIAAATQGHTPDDYWDGNVPPGFVFNHLINHSATDGYYLPVDFPQAFFVEEISIGSAVVLLQELEALGPVLAEHYPEEMQTALTTPDDEEPEGLTGPVRVWQALRRLCHWSAELDLPICLG
ncbi:MAG TPA: hypothetical protein VGK74_08310 [Symbiobacteriaceae bacterium]|jgi:hypothetical protein